MTDPGNEAKVPAEEALERVRQAWLARATNRMGDEEGWVHVAEALEAAGYPVGISANDV